MEINKKRLGIIRVALMALKVYLVCNLDTSDGSGQFLELVESIKDECIKQGYSFSEVNDLLKDIEARILTISEMEAL